MKKSEVPLILRFLKWYYAIGIVSTIILLLLRINKGGNYFLESWQRLFPNISPLFVNLWTTTFFVLSILIVYGIVKRNVVGFYGIMITQTLQILMLLSNFSITNTFYLVGINLFGLFATSGLLYLVYHDKNYFFKSK